jgi:hypothetical protein
MVESRPFEWKQEPEAEKLLYDILNAHKNSCPFLGELEFRLHEETSTNLFDWIDHLVVAPEADLVDRLVSAGFVEEFKGVYHHPGAQLPRVRISEDAVGVAVKVEWISDFLSCWRVSAEIEGTPFSGYRRAEVARDGNTCCWVVERRGSRTVKPVDTDIEKVLNYHRGIELWASRPRDSRTDSEMMDAAQRRAQQLVALVGQDMAAWIVLTVERNYWQSRNRAAQIQKNRQDHLGMGWANHDHHTFRSSRAAFKGLVHLFETLGFHCRERFYAGAEAGWGAQVMENSNCGLVLFLDVDVAPEEVGLDYTRETLVPLPTPGTVGLWCALHGDSVFQAGMHHLEAQFYFEDLTTDLADSGIRMMEPFSNFSYLKQAFTEGEKWKVDRIRAQAQVEAGVLSQEQAKAFCQDGVIGSHLENLQRREGYKGFNKKNVSFIIKKTDPRLQPQ